MKKMIQFGGGNIGRSFTGQVFARAGYEVIFVDIDTRLITAMNEKRGYRVIVKHHEGDKEIKVDNIRAINALDLSKIRDEILSANIICTSVGKNVLPKVIPVICEGLKARFATEAPPIDIIIAENIRNGADYFRELINSNLPDFNIDKNVGLIETSIGKMVPIMSHKDIARDPLWVFAEGYNNLILDGKGFKNPLPEIEALKPVDNIAAYVDRKLFIHNLGHSATAYLTFSKDPKLKYIWEGLELEEVFINVKQCMSISAKALSLAYPDDLKFNDLQIHIDDLLKRFRNRALGDTVFRVGRDLKRKLYRDDRIIGPLLLSAQYNLDFSVIKNLFYKALEFKARDENNEPFPDDLDFHNKYGKNPKAILSQICNLTTKESTLLNL